MHEVRLLSYATVVDRAVKFAGRHRDLGGSLTDQNYSSKEIEFTHNDPRIRR
jgi:hypothetical protein